MPLPDPTDRDWLNHSPKAIEEYVGGLVGIIVAEYAAEVAHLKREVGIIVAEYAAEVAHLKREVAYLEARLAAEKQQTVEETLS